MSDTANRITEDDVTANRDRWAIDVLKLSLVADETDSQISGHASAAFFRSLEGDNFYANDEKLAATAWLVNRSKHDPYLGGMAFLSADERLLEVVDGLIAELATTLGRSESDADADRVRQRLRDLQSDPLPPTVQRYAHRVLQADQVSKFPVTTTKPLSKDLAKAVFQVAATRSSRRCHVRQQLVDHFREAFTRDELNEAIGELKVNFGIAHARFHQPFLTQLVWDADSIDKHSLPEPNTSGMPTATAGAVQGTQDKVRETNNIWLLVVLVIVFAVTGAPRIVQTIIRNASKPSPNQTVSATPDSTIRSGDKNGEVVIPSLTVDELIEWNRQFQKARKNARLVTAKHFKTEVALTDQQRGDLARLQRHDFVKKYPDLGDVSQAFEVHHRDLFRKLSDKARAKKQLVSESSIEDVEEKSAHLTSGSSVEGIENGGVESDSSPGVPDGN